MSINLLGRRARDGEEQYDVYEADAERLYDSFSDLYDDFDEGRSKTPFVIIGALLAVAIVGGGFALAYRQGSSDGADGPAVILAERTPTKVELQDPGGIEIPHQDRQVFNEVAGDSTGDAAPKDDVASSVSVSESVESPTDELGRAGFTAGRSNDTAGNDQPTASSDDSGEFTIGALASRVTRTTPVPIEPAGRRSGLASAGEDAAQSITQLERQPPSVAIEPTLRAAPESPSLGNTPSAGTGVFEPRRVQTVAIGPDGSVISEQRPTAGQAETQAPSGGDSSGAGARALTPAVIPTPARPATETPQVPEHVASSSFGTNDSNAGSDPIEAALRAGAERLQRTADTESGTEAQTTLFAPSPRPKPRPTTRLAAAEPTAATRPQIPASATNAAAARAIEGFAVQVASHRRQAEAVAAFADLQQRYPSLISGYQPLIQRADLGERGIFYRLRIGPVATKGDADQLCASLKNAGLPGCLVRQL